MKKQTFSKGLFVIRFFEYEKSYLFHIQKSKKSHENKKVNAVALALFRAFIDRKADPCYNNAYKV